MAALRIFARSKVSAFLQTSIQLETIKNNSPAVIQVHKRWGNYKSSPIYKDPSHYTDYDVSRDPKEWECVERLLRPKTIPVPHFDNKSYPSGWKPPVSEPGKYPYFIQRTKNFMQPVYLEISFRGMRRITVIRKIQGDIWTLESELQKHIKNIVGKTVGSRVNEFSGELQLRGDYVSIVKRWLDEKGF